MSIKYPYSFESGIKFRIQKHRVGIFVSSYSIQVDKSSLFKSDRFKEQLAAIKLLKGEK